jgi:hypothetical protein
MGNAGDSRAGDNAGHDRLPPIGRRVRPRGLMRRLDQVVDRRPLRNE